MTRPTLVFLGDSITAANRQDPDLDLPLGDGFVSMIAEDVAGTGVEVVNLGVNGDRARNLAAQVEQVRAVDNPLMATVYVGVNDTWRRFDSGQVTPDSDFMRDLMDAIDGLRAVGFEKVLLLGPFLLPLDEEQAEMVDDLEHRIELIRQVAEATDTPLIELLPVFEAATAQHERGDLAPDGVHPSRLGHELIRDAWWDGVGQDGLVP